MKKQRVLLTGATGTMGLASLQLLLEDRNEIDLVILVRPTEIDKKILEPFMAIPELTIIWGDLKNYEEVKKSVEAVDIILHVGAFVSPAADYYPKQAMAVNYGSTVNLITAIHELDQVETTAFVFIGTVAQTGDRMPPIHWGRVGDPLKPSVYDYYAVSKIAAERYTIESGLKKWVSLRQTGIISPGMAKIEDPIMFHNCLDNVLEYVSDRDSARLLRNLCRKERNNKLKENFWGHLFNIGGGEHCRSSTYDMYSKIFSELGIHGLNDTFDSKWFATRNFHGQYYLDSDKLNQLLDFRRDGLDYFYQIYLDTLGVTRLFSLGITKLPGGQKLMGQLLKKRFGKLTTKAHGTLTYLNEDRLPEIAAYWGSKTAWENIPTMSDFKPFNNWDKVIKIEHGYDETKSEVELTLEDIQGAALFRGGSCHSKQMTIGDWTTPLTFNCAFGHVFQGSPRLILEGGHWCSTCERESWNYYERAKRDPFFAQIWYPLHPKDEPAWEYPKIVSELSIDSY